MTARRADAVIRAAQLEGFGGQCGRMAIAINRGRVRRQGPLRRRDEPHISKHRGRMFMGHVVARPRVRPGLVSTDHHSTQRPDWWLKAAPEEDRVCYDTKTKALKAFLDTNYEVVQNYGGADYAVSPSEFDSINHKYNLHGPAPRGRSRRPCSTRSVRFARGSATG